MASWKNLIVVSDASRTTPAKRRFADTVTDPAGETAALVTFAASFTNVNVVDVGTDVITYVPLNVASTPVITAISPTAYP